MKMKKQSVELMNNLIKDALHQIATHAAAKMGRRKTLKVTGHVVLLSCCRQ